MKTIHVLAVDEEADRFARLIEAVTGLGLRVGWLDLESLAEIAPELASPVRAGVHRAVALTENGTLAAKRLTGEVPLGDLLRQYFLGCRLVLVRGDVEAPRLERGPQGWSIRTSDGAALQVSDRALAARLRRPAATFLQP